MVMVNTKIYQKMQKQKLFEYRKNYYKMKKKTQYSHKKLFSFRKFVFFRRARIFFQDWAR